MAHDVPHLLDQLSELKARLSVYEYHHRNCSLGTRLENQPALDHSLNHAAAEKGGGEHLDIIPYDPRPHKQRKKSLQHNSRTVANGILAAVPAPKLNIIEPGLSKRSRGKSSILNPRWVTVINELLDAVPTIDRWTDLRRRIGVDTDDQNTLAISVVAGYHKSTHYQSHDNISMAGTRSFAVSDCLISSAKDYARKTTISRVEADLTCLLHRFQDLVLLSLCYVLEYHKLVEEQVINEILRICHSDSEAIHLMRLRRGAQWVSGTIVALAKAGWQHRATELFFLCGLSASKYSILADNTSNTFKAIVGRFTDSTYHEISKAIDRPGRIQWSIPAFIKTLVKDDLTLDQICTALGYESSEDLKRLCSHYATMGILTIQQSSKQRGEGEPTLGRNKAPTAKCKSYYAGRVEGPGLSVTTLEASEDEEATALLTSPGLVSGPDRSVTQGPQDTFMGRSYDNFGHDTDRSQPEQRGGNPPADIVFGTESDLQTGNRNVLVDGVYRPTGLVDEQPNSCADLGRGPPLAVHDPLDAAQALAHLFTAGHSCSVTDSEVLQANATKQTLGNVNHWPEDNVNEDWFANFDAEFNLTG